MSYLVWGVNAGLTIEVLYAPPLLLISWFELSGM